MISRTSASYSIAFSIVEYDYSIFELYIASVSQLIQPPRIRIQPPARDLGSSETLPSRFSEQSALISSLCRFGTFSLRSFGQRYTSHLCTDHCFALHRHSRSLTMSSSAHSTQCNRNKVHAPFPLSAFFLALRTMMIPMNDPIAERPSRSRIAGILIAHSRAGNIEWMLDSGGKKG